MIGRADTRHYAKRQFTWFRHQLPEFEWVTPETAGAWLEAHPCHSGTEWRPTGFRWASRTARQPCGLSPCGKTLAERPEPR